VLKPTIRFWILFSLSIVLFTLWFFFSDEIFQQLTIFNGSIVLSCFIWSLLSISGIDVDRKSRLSRQKVGEYFEEFYIIKNQTAYGHFNIQITGFTSLKGIFSSKVISYLGPKKERTYNSFVLLEKRGLINLGPTIVESSDPLKLFVSKKEILKTQSSVLVYPHILGLSRFIEPFGFMAGGISLRKSSSEITPHAASIREYVAGDPLQRIHWPSTLRKNKYMVKEFDQDPQSNVWIYLDSNNRIHFQEVGSSQNKLIYLNWVNRQRSNYQLPRDTYEYAICIAASILRFYIKQKKLVGFSSNGKTLIQISADKGDRQLAKILETLSFVMAEGDLPLLGLINTESKNMTKGSTVVIITTSAENQIEICAEILLQRGLIPIMIILDINSFSMSRKRKPIEEKIIKTFYRRIYYQDNIKEKLESIEYG